MSFPMIPTFNPSAFSQVQAPTGFTPQQQYTRNARGQQANAPRPRPQGPTGFAALQQMGNVARQQGNAYGMANPSQQFAGAGQNYDPRAVLAQFHQQSMQPQAPVQPGGYGAIGAGMPPQMGGQPQQFGGMANLLEEFRRRQALMAHFAALRGGGLMGGTLGGGGGMGAVGGAVNGMFGGF